MGQIFEAGGPFGVTGGPFGPPVNMLAEALALLVARELFKLGEGRNTCQVHLAFAGVVQDRERSLGPPNLVFSGFRLLVFYLSTFLPLKTKRKYKNKQLLYSG